MIFIEYITIRYKNQCKMQSFASQVQLFVIIYIPITSHSENNDLLHMSVGIKTAYLCLAPGIFCRRMIAVR